MEFKPSLPHTNDNVSHNRPLREFFILFTGITVFFLIIFWAAGLFVDFVAGYISPEMEAKIFSSFTVSEGRLADAEDPGQKKLQQMSDRLRECLDITYPLTVHLVNSKTANALALPGGRIIVFKGLLDKVSSENGLSFVLAHELSHFKNRDHLRGMGRGLVITMVAALVTGAGSDITQLFAPTIGLNMAGYSRKREALADVTALKVLNCRYGHVGGADEFFKAMTPPASKKTRILTQYFSSHPEAVSRIEHLKTAAEKLNFVTNSVISLPTVFKNKNEES